MFRTLVFLMLCGASVPAFAQSAEDLTRIAPALLAIDTVPTRAELDAAFANPTAVLQAAALQTERTVYERKRAISLLSLYPVDDTQVFLASLMSDADPEIRGFAAYTAARTFGAAPNAALVATLELALQDSSVEVKKWALRGLRWVRAPRADALLAHYASQSDAELARVARSAAKKRATIPVKPADM